MPKKSKVVKELEPVIEEEEEEEDDDDDDEEEEEEGEEEDEDEDDDDTVQDEQEAAPDHESDEGRVKRLRDQRRNTRRNARQSGYRKWAKMAGLRSTCTESFGNDLLKSVFSHSDIIRMATWAPHSADAGIDFPEFKRVLQMRDSSLSSGPVKVLQASVESFARKLVNDVVLRSVEAQGGMTITAANVKSVLRPFNGVLRTEISTPLGLVRAAQHFEKNDETVLPRSAEEDIAIADERKFCKANHAKVMRDADRARDAVIAERKKRKSDPSTGDGIAVDAKKKKKKKKTAAAAAAADSSDDEAPVATAAVADDTATLSAVDVA